MFDAYGLLMSGFASWIHMWNFAMAFDTQSLIPK